MVETLLALEKGVYTTASAHIFDGSIALHFFYGKF
jgi:hypothetical protein